ncbi:hypothetical protein BN1805_01049 [Proteus vulgaris]|nr:hypothetical protein BN1805_01049 [Proteus vulgaris]
MRKDYAFLIKIAVALYEISLSRDFLLVYRLCLIKIVRKF